MHLLTLKWGKSEMNIKISSAVAKHLKAKMLEDKIPVIVLYGSDGNKKAGFSFTSRPFYKGAEGEEADVIEQKRANAIAEFRNGYQFMEVDGLEFMIPDKIADHVISIDFESGKMVSTVTQ